MDLHLINHYEDFILMDFIFNKFIYESRRDNLGYILTLNNLKIYVNKPFSGILKLKYYNFIIKYLHIIEIQPEINILKLIENYHKKMFKLNLEFDMDKHYLIHWIPPAPKLIEIKEIVLNKIRKYL